MKKSKFLLCLLSVVTTACLLGGCKSSGNAKVVSTKEPEVVDVSDNPDSTEVSGIVETPEVSASPDTYEEETDDNKNDAQFSFADISNLEFWYGSGVGAWCTVLTVDEEGNFKGQYHDSDMGSTGEGYPNGTYYLSDFKGKFTNPEKVNEYTYSVRIENIELEEQPDTEEIKDETKYIYSEPYGLDNAEEILIYLPGIRKEDLPEGFLSWMTSIEFKDGKLPCYGLYNVKGDEGFSGYERVENSAIDDELAAIEKEAADLEKIYQKDDITQSEMTQTSWEIYELWDKELNAIWKRLKEKLDTKTMEELTNEEKEWITNKESEMKKAGAEFEGGTIQPMIENDRGAEMTKERVYELADYLR